MGIHKPKVILFDIEGTTTSIDFVKSILFPYAKDHFNQYLIMKKDTPEVTAIINDLKSLPEFADFLIRNSSDSNSLSALIEFINYLIDMDSKTSPLKVLQGLVWENGYHNGILKGHVFDDVPKMFEKWFNQGYKLCIYSSGSVHAQKLLFQHSEHGNLLPFISDHFDTKIGHKQQAESYLNIASKLNIPCKEILFLTDIIEEANAAAVSGMSTVILIRPGNKPLQITEESLYTTVKNFYELDENWN